MEKTPFIVSVRYREVTQPQQYHSQEAEVSAQYTVPEDQDAPASIASGLSMVKSQVRIALGKESGPLTAVATEPAKRGPGRPPKVKDEPKPEPAPEPEAPQPETAPASEDDFAEPAEDKPKEITDAEVQAACRDAVAKGAGKVLAADVKNMARLRYGTDKVVAIKQEDRAKFLVDLKNLVAEKSKK